MEKEKIIEWCKNILLTDKGIVNKMYTRNNFEIVKKRWPDVWDAIKNTSIEINGKTIYFRDDYIMEPLFINGIQYNAGGKLTDNQFSRKIRFFLNDKNYVNCKELLNYIITHNISGTRLVLLVQKIFPEEYHKIMQYKKDSLSEREMIYRYLNNIKDAPKINGKKLRLWTYKIGYLYYRGYELVKNIPPDDYFNICKKLMCSYADVNPYTQGTQIIKRFFPEIIVFLNEKYHLPIEQALFLFVNNVDSPPKCLNCMKKTCNFDVFSNGYHSFCSIKCVARFQSNKRFEKNVSMEGYKPYQRNVWILTNRNYKKYKEVINPLNYPRGIFSKNKKVYQLDHNIPVVYGYVNNIRPEIIAHRKNLQIITALDNNKKNDYLIYSEEEINKRITDIMKEIENG